MKLDALACVACAALAAGCASTNLGPPATAGPPVSVRLNASSYNAGNVGLATLVPAPQANATAITLDFSGVPSNTTMPAHIYTYIYEASCANLPPQAAYSLNEQVLTSRARSSEFNLKHTIAVPMDQLLSGRYALALRSAPADGNRVIFCGDLRRS